LGEGVVFDLITGQNFQGKHIYFDNVFTSFKLLEKLKLQNIKAWGTIRPDRAGIQSDFAKKNKMERGDYKSMIISNSIVFICMDTKHVFLASNYHWGCGYGVVLSLSQRQHPLSIKMVRKNYPRRRFINMELNDRYRLPI